VLFFRHQNTGLQKSVFSVGQPVATVRQSLGYHTDAASDTTMANKWKELNVTFYASNTKNRTCYSFGTSFLGVANEMLDSDLEIVHADQYN
jgi:hypothetical protein